jgi:hypothetical protein
MSRKASKMFDEIEMMKKLSIAEGIRDSSRSLYARILVKLKRICAPFDIGSMISNPDRTIEQLRSSKEINSPVSLTNAVSTVKSIIKHCFTKSEIPDVIRERWAEIYKEVQAPVKDDFDSGKTKTTMTWRQVWEKNQTLYDKAMSQTANRLDVADALMSSMYVDLDPRRQEDYSRLYVKTTSAPSPETSYIDMTLAEPMIFVTEYKTSESLKAWSKKIPERLLNLLKLSLKATPRDYVFVGANGLPYATAGTWAKHHNSKLRKWFGKGSTNVGLRHARSSAITEEGKSYSLKDRKAISRDMGHSVFTNLAYGEKEETVIKDGKYTATKFSKEKGKYIEFLCTEK